MTASVASVCCITVDSVISSSSMSAGSPLSFSTRAISSGRCGSLNWRADRLTATGMRLSTPMRAAQTQAWRSTVSPSFRISPVSSAICMKSAGGITPFEACGQRTSASCMTTQPVFSSVIG